MKLQLKFFSILVATLLAVPSLSLAAVRNNNGPNSKANKTNVVTPSATKSPIFPLPRTKAFFRELGRGTARLLKPDAPTVTLMTSLSVFAASLGYALTTGTYTTETLTVLQGLSVFGVGAGGSMTVVSGVWKFLFRQN